MSEEATWTPCPECGIGYGYHSEGCEVYLKELQETEAAYPDISDLETRIVGLEKMLCDAQAEIERLREALLAVDSEIVLPGQLKDIVDSALSRST